VRNEELRIRIDSSDGGHIQNAASSFLLHMRDGLLAK
jgi:hypothetical protein